MDIDEDEMELALEAIRLRELERQRQARRLVAIAAVLLGGLGIWWLLAA